MVRTLLLSLSLGMGICSSGGSAAEVTQQPGAVPKTISDILAQLETIKPDEAALADAAAILKSEPPKDADRITLAKFYLNRSRANRTMGSVEQMLSDSRNAAALTKGMNTGLEWNTLIELSNAEIWGGNYLNVIKADERLAAASSPGDAINGYSHLARYKAAIGDLEGAESALRSTEGLLLRLRSEREWFTYSSNYIATTARARAAVFAAKGQYREAEAADQEAIVRTDEAIASRLQYSKTPPIYLLVARDSIELVLASQIQAQGRLQEAEWHARNALQRTLRRVTGTAPEIPSNLNALISILYAEGRYNESRALALVAVRMLEQSRAEPIARPYLLLLAAEGRSLVALGDYSGALKPYNQIRTSLSAFPALQRAYARGDADWALALINSGMPVEGADMLRELIKELQTRFGARNAETAIAQGELGVALVAQGDKAGALAEFRPATDLLLEPNSLTEASPATLARIELIVENYIALLAEFQTKGEAMPGGVDPAAEAFRLADAIRGRSVQAAVTEAAARSAATAPGLGELTRKDQDLKLKASALYDIVNRQLSSPPDQQSPELVTQLRHRIEAIGEERRNLAATIRKDFPAYANLIHPRAATPEDTRKALAPDEALLSVLVTPKASYIWAIPKSGAMSFAVSRLTGNDVTALVASLRKSVDPGPTTIDSLPPYDIAAGYRLYAELLAPVETGWRGAKDLLIVANGALAQLPFGLLPTQLVKPVVDDKLRFGEFKAIPWLIKVVAVTQVPSASAIVTLRGLRAVKTGRLPFVGFGDPQFSRSPTLVADSTRGVHLRTLAVMRPPQEGTETQTSTGPIARTVVEPAEWVAYSQLPPLPDTREEILAIALALQADPQRDVFFGTAANTRNVTTLDLSRRRVIAFATHGLLAGDMPNLTQPALALAAPDDPNQSGLLTLDDILALKLDADWVVLSACNTAAGDGAGAEAISGLGRGFFYAGSRALLVTHWPVETVSARTLVTGIFERFATDPSLSRAEALRQSMLALMDETAADGTTGQPRFSYAHPIFWAPYALVGDPGR